MALSCFAGDNMAKNKSEKKDDNFLLYIPIKKHQRWDVRDGKVYLIFEHNRAVEKLVRWLVKKPNVSDIELDDVGSTVWQLIDGERTVYDIGQELLSRYGESCQPVYERLIMYIRYLNRKAWIAFDRGNQN